MDDLIIIHEQKLRFLKGNAHSIIIDYMNLYDSIYLFAMLYTMLLIALLCFCFVFGLQYFVLIDPNTASWQCVNPKEALIH